jgi:hypothetical protein
VLNHFEVDKISERHLTCYNCIAKVTCKLAALQNKIIFIYRFHRGILCCGEHLAWLFFEVLSLWPPCSSSFVFGGRSEVLLWWTPRAVISEYLVCGLPFRPPLFFSQACRRAAFILRRMEKSGLTASQTNPHPHTQTWYKNLSLAD